MNRVIESYCWVTGTWTTRLSKGEIHGESGKVSHLGQGECDFDNPDPKSENCWQHKYYPWVALTLAAQIIFFLAPKFLWDALEANKVGSLLEGEEIEKKNAEGKIEKEVIGALTRKAMVRGLHTTDDLAQDKHMKALVQKCFDTRGQHDGWASKLSVTGSA